MAEKTMTYEDYIAELTETFAEIARLEQEIDEVRACNDKPQQRRPLLH